MISDGGRHWHGSGLAAKQCIRCLLVKDINEFHKQGARLNRSSFCKTCDVARKQGKAYAASVVRRHKEPSQCRLCGNTFFACTTASGQFCSRKCNCRFQAFARRLSKAINDIEESSLIAFKTVFGKDYHATGK